MIYRDLTAVKSHLRVATNTPEGTPPCAMARQGIKGLLTNRKIRQLGRVENATPHMETLDVWIIRYFVDGGNVVKSVSVIPAETMGNYLPLFTL